jgi:hypothetical protein
MDVYLEVGKKRVFVGALAWPGWCRSGKEEAKALETLLAYAPRYGQAIASAGLGFAPPETVEAFKVVELLQGNAGTDFGAPSIAPAEDDRPVSAAELGELQALLAAAWETFDRAAAQAEGKVLTTGPRGGGRDREKITEHVLEAELAYLRRLGGSLKLDKETTVQERLRQERAAVQVTLAAAARGEIAEMGPRGGKRWTPRYFVRRTAWHLLDHAWEIEDRMMVKPL